MNMTLPQVNTITFVNKWRKTKDKTSMLCELHEHLNHFEEKCCFELSPLSEIEQNPHSKYHLLFSLAAIADHFKDEWTPSNREFFFGKNKGALRSKMDA